MRTISLFFCGMILLIASLTSAAELHPAQWQQRQANQNVQCLLCPFRCVLAEGQRGQCGTRKNIQGKLYALNYGKVVSLNIDPIEKKPVFHFLPQSFALSFACAGCNLHCKFCQNWEIAQALPEDIPSTPLTSQGIVELAQKYRCASIAYTYAEPTVFYEFMYDTARAARAAGIKNVMISNGYMNAEPLKELCKYMDVIKVDLKGFSSEFYRDVVFGDLSRVLETLKTVKEQGVFLEIVHLVVPTLNDEYAQIRQMCLWIKENLGDSVPLHFTRFHPMYKLKNLPPTPVETLEKARQIALSCGLKYVYIGNVPGHTAENTYCPKCGKLLLERKGYKVLENNIVHGTCRFCGEKIPGIWE